MGMAEQKAQFSAFVALAYHLEAKKSFINDSDSLTIHTACYDAYILKFANFCG